MTREVDRKSIEDLLHAASPSRVADALGIAVVRRGAHLQCVCPFHDDHDPSLVLYDSWESRPPHHHCYVCGADGDVFDMVRHVRGISFGEAAEWLRSAFGLPSRKLRFGRERREFADGSAWDGSTQAAFSFAAETYRKRNDAYQLDAWLSSRNIPQDIAAQAGLSYASESTLTNSINGPGGSEAGQSRIEAAMLEEVGLLRRFKRASRLNPLFGGADSRYRDFFFDARIIFPIQSIEGDVIGFAGRAVVKSDGDIPKYLYSPGLAKSTILYRGNSAIELIKAQDKLGRRKEIFVCEGLVDALRIESRGYPAVSILGARASKGQVEQLRRIADAVAPAGDLLVHIFMDRDKAGVRGSSKLALALAAAGLEADFIWPQTIKLEQLGVQPIDDKDPDSIISALNESWNDDFIMESAHPSALPVIASKLEAMHSLDELLHDEVWNGISLGARYRAAQALTRNEAEASFLLNTSTRGSFSYNFSWFDDVKKLRSSTTTGKTLQNEGYSTEFVADEASRLNIARVLAKSGADRGEVPTDDAAWRRLEAGATAFNFGLRERLQEPTFEPLEPFDAVFVARNFENVEPRLKAMPCPEDLVLQQYMLSEILTERFDGLKEDDCFSISIPAVRFYRNKGVTLTTAENGSANVNSQTLSFAYQIDMDVLEGRSRASNQGMFRPYIECWYEYISSLRITASGFDQVYALRLDLKRYYDRLYRSVVKNALQEPFREALERLDRSERKEDFAPSFSRNRQNVSDSIVDWFCEQSFGYQYYHPETGRITKSEENIGIPQGPVLSAWIATVALFPLDCEIRKVLEKFNSNDTYAHAGYARYVDDIFLIADSSEILEELRTAVEDACARLRLHAIPKGELAPCMTPDEFNDLLMEGKALVGSGPSSEIGLISLGDGEAGFENWYENIQRTSALALLSDRRLYEADVKAIKGQIFTALSAHDLRPAELSKAARWIWYAVAQEASASTPEAWNSYWAIWNEVMERLTPKMNVATCPWHDPSLYALDGLEQLLRSVKSNDRNLSITAEMLRKKSIVGLSKLVVQAEFFNEFAFPQADPPRNAGKGVLKLRRMFLQRAVCVRWIARQMVPSCSTSMLSEGLDHRLGLSSNELFASLTRAWLTDADGATSDLEIPANVGSRLEYPSPLRPLFLWLHEAIVLLGRDWGGQQDPLINIRGKLREPSITRPNVGGSKFFRLLNLWKPDLPEHELVMLELRLDALAALLAVCHVDGVMSCLAKRPHLIESFGDPLPALPGIPLTHLVLKNTDQDGKCLVAVSQIYTNGRLPPSVDYRMAIRGEIAWLHPMWNELSIPIDTKLLAGRRAEWAGDARMVRKSQPVRAKTLGFRELRWAADCFDALALMSYELESDPTNWGEGELIEFVPAWPFISVSHWPEDSNSENVSFSLFGPVVPRTHLANFAFARDGKGRLRAYEVPLADARLWRIGYAVTDSLGMIDELERFEALELEGHPIGINTAQYVLTRLLGRLRGEGQPTTPGRRHPTRQHLTGATNRALSLLRSFPVDESPASEVQFLLAIEAETAAIRLQSDGHGDTSRPGILTSMLRELASAVFSRLTVKQLEALPKFALVDNLAGPERRVVAAWHLLDHRLGALESNLSGRIPSESRSAWTALRRAVRVATISAWVRALVFEMYLAGDAMPSVDVEIPSQWQIDDPCLVVDAQEVTVGALFRDALAPKGRIALTAKITPLGWLVLLANQLNLYGVDAARAVMPEERAEEMRAPMIDLALQLGVACPDNELVDDKWPFEASSKIESIFEEGSFLDALHLLTKIQSSLGYRIRNCKSHIWGISPQAKSFTDESGRQWPTLRGLIDQIGRDRHVEIDEFDEKQRVWTQTTSSSGKLIGVSVLGETFAKTAGMQGQHSLFDGGSVNLKDYLIDELPAIKISNKDHDAVAIEASAVGEDVIAKTNIQDGDMGKYPPNNSVEVSEVPPEKIFKLFREIQDREWSTRRTAKSAGHVRFAFFQFKIDDSYYHPIVDGGFPDFINRDFCDQVSIDSVCSLALAELSAERAGKKVFPSTWPAQRARASLSDVGLEGQWDRSELVPSWNEHRRRRLIDEAIRACHEFAVDVLVLPEYCVRPDTVEWLRERLSNLPSAKLSVVAGTYRLHGSPKDLHFKERFENIFGVEDKKKVFSLTGGSMEKSAYLTLLQPIKNEIPGLVGVFSRRKKFHSMAMSEFINPSGEIWAPLASLEGLISVIDRARINAKMPPLDVKSAIAIASRVRPSERMAELICSELFLSTHPVNHEAIRSEYQSLRRRFGHDLGKADDDQVVSDILSLTAALRLDDRVDRRTILVVPACTTRSADYWIYGQSALLAAGLTTIFCAAVLSDSKGGLKGGGSCIIAKSSWSVAHDDPGHLLISTPYSGWSRGIYYNRAEDVLTKKEQAVVIADIDPIYMNEGKPRPQALPVPIQLVAHLPVIEMLDGNRLAEAYTPNNGGFFPASLSLKAIKSVAKIQDIERVADCFRPISEFLRNVRPAYLVDSKILLSNGKEIAEVAKEMANFFSEPSGWTNRLECWAGNWREMPFYGPPPALVDWLPVDLSPIDGKIPEILIPPWGGDFGEASPFNNS